MGSELLFPIMKQSSSKASFNHVEDITLIFKVKFLTNIILETSNAVESLHSHMYLAYSLKKGSKRFSILEGLRNLYNYYQDIEQTSNAVSHKINYFYFTNDIEGEKVPYGQDEPWKNLKSIWNCLFKSQK